MDGRTAVVTGAGRGIGKGCAIALAEAGADVVLISRTRAELEAVAGEVERLGRHARALALDVTDAAGITAAFAEDWRIDVLVNNAGTNIPQPFLDVTEEELSRVIDVNVRGGFLVAQAVARQMVARGQGGSIINISSDFGHVGTPFDRSVYCATKHALEGLTKATALELAKHGIRVNSIAPTFIETPLTAPFLGDPTFRDRVLSHIPLGRFGRVEDVMGAVVFLSSDAAALMTGTSLVIDGGWTAQ